MGLPEIYEKYFGGEKAAAEKKAEGGEAAAAATAATATAEKTEGAEETQLTDEDLDKALEGMTEEQLSELAKEVGDNIKASQAKAAEENEKLAEEYFAAGRIFARGFMAETNGEKTASPKGGAAMQKFSALLEKELKDRKSTRLNSSHIQKSRMPSSA